MLNQVNLLITIIGPKMVIQLHMSMITQQTQTNAFVIQGHWSHDQTLIQNFK